LAAIHSRRGTIINHHHEYYLQKYIKCLIKVQTEGLLVMIASILS